MRRPPPHWPSLHGPRPQPPAAPAPAPAPEEGWLSYVAHYPPETVARARRLAAEGRLAEAIAARCPEPHAVQTDAALRAYALDLKDSYLRSSPPLSKVCYDQQLHAVQNALGTHTFVSRVQGARLKAKHELRVSHIFKEAPELLLRMIVVHELAHIREKEHNKAFYALCEHMLPDYHALELYARLFLIERELRRGAPPREVLGEVP
ncbi:MAG: M48 family metallopeptidase [Deltaproteobacteria bacterium]|nr:M48 family metallopeptidase [Deltaproteobacteria bacterium]